MTLELTPFAWFHTVLGLIALLSGVIVLFGLLGSRALGGWTTIFIVSSIATSVTGFGFGGPFGASHWVGVISLMILAVAILARYVRHLTGAWRWVYAVSAVLTLYFLVFVLIAQAFKKVPALYAMAPTLAEPPFAYTQTANLVMFIILMIAVARAFHPQSVAR